MLVVDSSVWIDYLNNVRTDRTARLDEVLGRESILVGDIILCEILQGFRNEAEARRIEALLRNFQLASMFDPDLAVRAAANYRALRRLGVTVSKLADLVIATFCIEKGHTLLHDDRDFDAIERHLGLRVF